MSAKLAAALVVIIGAGRADGEDKQAAPIATDRPSVTNSSAVVPSGSLQVENGFAWNVAFGQDTLDGSESLLRFGVTSKTELCVTVPDYFRQVGTGPERISGSGDPAI